MTTQPLHLSCLGIPQRTCKGRDKCSVVLMLLLVACLAKQHPAPTLSLGLHWCTKKRKTRLTNSSFLDVKKLSSKAKRKEKEQEKEEGARKRKRRKTRSISFFLQAAHALVLLLKYLHPVQYEVFFKFRFASFLFGLDEEENRINLCCLMSCVVEVCCFGRCRCWHQL